MYVLRRIFPDVDEPDFKAFGSLSDARALLKTTEPRIPGDIESAALFYVPGENDGRRAVDLVRRGEPDRVVLLKLDFLTESLDVPALREIVDEVLRRP